MKTALACSGFGLGFMLLTAFFAFSIWSQGAIPHDLTFKDVIVAGGTWTFFLAAFAGIAMFVIGILGVHFARREEYERSQILWGLGVAALGCGIAALPLGVIIDGSRSVTAWVFLFLGMATFGFGLSECWLPVERDND